MDQITQLAAALTHRLRLVRGTQESFTTDLGDVFYQAASYEGDAVLIEITGDEFLPDDRRLTHDQQEQLMRLGFTRPDDEMPNWWIGIEDGRDRGLFAAARAVVTALVEVHGVSLDDLAADLPLERYSRYQPQTLHQPSAPTHAEGEPLGVHTTYGDVLLYPNRYATLNGEPWAERPVREWFHLDDGRLAITLAAPGDGQATTVGFVADNSTHVGTLRRFLPGREDQALLPLRLSAVLAHRLRKLRGTQTMFTTDLGEAFFQAASCEGDAVLVEITGEEFLPDDRRLTGAQEEHLLRLGFNRPDETMPNWWIRIPDGRDRDLFAAARAVITALIEVHGVSTDTLTAELPLYRYSPYPPRTLQPGPNPTAGEGEPLGVQTTYGDVLLYPTGTPPSTAPGGPNGPSRNGSASTTAASRSPWRSPATTTSPTPRSSPTPKTTSASCAASCPAAPTRPTSPTGSRSPSTTR